MFPWPYHERDTITQRLCSVVLWLIVILFGVLAAKLL